MTMFKNISPPASSFKLLAVAVAMLQLLFALDTHRNHELVSMVWPLVISMFWFSALDNARCIQYISGYVASLFSILASAVCMGVLLYCGSHIVQKVGELGLWLVYGHVVFLVGSAQVLAIIHRS